MVFFKKKDQPFSTKHVFLVLFLISLVLVIKSCGSKDLTEKTSGVSNFSNFIKDDLVEIEASLSYSPLESGPVTITKSEDSSLSLQENDSLGLVETPQRFDRFDLVSVGTGLKVSVTGCASGYTVTNVSIASGVVNLYKGDRNCLVKLTEFTLGSTTYSTSGVNAVPFTTWLAGNVATFQSTTLSTDLIKVVVVTQVTQGGVTGADAVSYKFTDTLATTTSNITTSSYTFSVTGTSSAHPGVTTGSSLFAAVSGCASSYSTSATSIASGGVRLYKGDLSCLVKLTSFTLGSQAYTLVGASAVPFTTWLVNDFAIFQGSSVSDTLRVTVTAQVTQGGVIDADTIAYTYADNVSCSAGFFAGGSGTAGDPFQVATRTHLEDTVACTTSTSYFIQTANIDLTGSGAPWTPIQLYGQYNGNSKSISNLYVNDTTGAAVGLFSIMNTGSSVSSLTLSSINLTGGQNIGGLAASAVAATVTGCTVSGTISAQSIAAGSGLNAGGLIGLMSNGGTVSTSSSSVNLTFAPSTVSGGNWHGVGGLIGHTGSSATLATTITDSFATGTVNSSSGTTSASNLGLGSLVGYTTANASTSVTITRNYTTGSQTHSVVGNATANVIGIGGIVGLLLNTTTSDLIISKNFVGSGTFTIASTTNSNIQIGGLIGARNGGAAAISDSYSMASISVTGTAATSVGGAGGFMGNRDGSTITDSYSASPSVSGSGMRSTALYGFYGTGSTGTLTTDYYYDNAGVATQPATTGLTAYTTTTQMQTQSNYTGFSFGSVWRMPSVNPLAAGGLLSPVLAWQCNTNGIICDVVSTCTNSPSFSGGDGTSGTPYEITTRAQLATINNCPSTVYLKLTQNIDLGGSATPWTPIALAAKFDGSGFTITGLYRHEATATSGANSGLFSTMSAGSSVSNLNITSADIVTGSSRTGILVGQATGATISNVTTHGSLSTANVVFTPSIILGGVAGEVNSSSVVSNVSSDASVTWSAAGLTSTPGSINIGGLIGSSSSSSLDTLSFTGSVSVTQTYGIQYGSFSCLVAGLSGTSTLTKGYTNATLNFNKGTAAGEGRAALGIGTLLTANALTVTKLAIYGTITVTGTTSGNERVAAVVAQHQVGNIGDSYSIATIVFNNAETTDNYAGFTGCPNSVAISTSYSGNPSMSQTNGIGFSETNCGTLTLTSDYLYDNPNVPSQTKTGLTSFTTITQMQTQSNFAGFDFTNVWVKPTANTSAPAAAGGSGPSGEILSPVLRWECGLHGITCP